LKLIGLAGIKLLDLPIELLQAIVDNFQLPRHLLQKYDHFAFSQWEDRHPLKDSRQTLSALSRTCKLLHSLARQVLYTCLLYTSYDDRQQFYTLVDAIQKAAASDPSVLRHARQIQLPASDLGTLRHTRLLTGLILEHPDPRHIPIPVATNLPQMTFQNLSHLQFLQIIRWGCASADVAPLLQNLYHLRNLNSMRLSYLEVEEPFEIAVGPRTLRQLELAGCCSEVTQPLLQALTASSLRYLEISEYDIVGDGEISVPKDIIGFPELETIELHFFDDVMTSGYLKSFQSLKHVILSNSIISEEMMSSLLRWLPPTICRLDLRTMASLEIFKPLYLWLHHTAATLAGMSIFVDFDKRRLLRNTPDQEDLWEDACLYAEKLLGVAEINEILVIPEDLPNVIARLSVDQESESEGGSTSIEDSSGDESDVTSTPDAGDDVQNAASFDEESSETGGQDGEQEEESPADQ
jgi:hypothetical protein